MAKASPNNNKKTSIQDIKAKHVTFSKRRSGIFKKASELCTLCAVEMAIIVFSPGGKPYSFAHPSPSAIIHKFTDSGSSNALTPTIGEGRSHREAMNAMGDLYKQYGELNAQLEEEKKRGKALKQMVKNFSDVDEMNRDQLVEFKASLEDLKLRVLNRKEVVLVEKSTDLTLTLGGIYS